MQHNNNIKLKSEYEGAGVMATKRPKAVIVLWVCEFRVSFSLMCFCFYRICFLGSKQIYFLLGN